MNVSKWLGCLLGSVFLTGCHTETVTLPEKYPSFTL